MIWADKMQTLNHLDFLSSVRESKRSSGATFSLLQDLLGTEFCGIVVGGIPNSSGRKIMYLRTIACTSKSILTKNRRVENYMLFVCFIRYIKKNEECVSCSLTASERSKIIASMKLYWNNCHPLIDCVRKK